MTKCYVLLCCFQLIVFVVQAYENVALNKTTWQRHTYKYGLTSADRAVDGRKTNLSYFGGECAVSLFRPKAEWFVDLGEILSIHHIFIQFATRNKLWAGYFLGFSVYLSNTSNTADGILCFRDTDFTRTTIPNPINVSCPYHGRFIIYHNNRSHQPFPDGYSNITGIDLCEVEVYGCPTQGYYGENCSIPCPGNCQDGRCDIVNGTCLGCALGYKGSKCLKECDGKKYGLECKQTCGECYNGEKCNHANGSCPIGCADGVFGDRCDTECPVGSFGYNCKDNCSINCLVPGKCDKVTGHCEGGCQVGWKNSKCDARCANGTYGQDCTESCGKCIKIEHCHHKHGTCSDGCKRGYIGRNCIESMTFLLLLSFPHFLTYFF